MAQKRISQLTQTTAPVLADLVELETASPSNSRKVELANLLFRAPDVVASADHTFADRYAARVAIITTGASDRSAKLPNSGVDDLAAGDFFEIHKADSGAGKITVDRQGTDTIDGATSVPLYSQGDHARVMYLGSGSYTVLDLKSHGSNADGEYARLSNGRQEATMWGFVQGDGASTFINDLNNTLPASFTEVESVQVSCTAYKVGSDPTDRHDGTAAPGTEVAHAFYDGTNLDVRIDSTTGGALGAANRWIWQALLIGRWRT